MSEDLMPEELGQVIETDRSGTNDGVSVSALPVTGSITLGMDGTARVEVSVSADEAAEESSKRFRLRSTNCPNCGSEHPAEIGMPSSAVVGIVSRGTVVAAGVYLQGAYDAGEGNLRTALISVLPRQQPYGVTPWDYPATTTVPHVDAEFGGLGSVTSTIVDWVLVELRTSAPGAGADAVQPTTGGRVAGLLLRDGRIARINEEATTVSDALSLDGVRFEVESLEGQDVYVLIHHRNHLSVMSARPTTATGCEADYCVDFRNQQSYRNCLQSLHSDGSYMMYAGDLDRDSFVLLGDDQFIVDNNLEPATYAQQGTNYLVDGDLDFDGFVLLGDDRAVVDNNLERSDECGSRP